MCDFFRWEESILCEKFKKRNSCCEFHGMPLCQKFNYFSTKDLIITLKRSKLMPSVFVNKDEARSDRFVLSDRTLPLIYRQFFMHRIWTAWLHSICFIYFLCVEAHAIIHNNKNHNVNVSMCVLVIFKSLATSISWILHSRSGSCYILHAALLTYLKTY